MTEVEFSRLLADLAETAKILNNESDSINGLIARFEESLRAINLGIEAWVGEISSEEWTEEDEDNERVIASGTNDTELGFTKHESEWRLMTRVAQYRRNQYGTFDLVRTWSLVRLERGSREVRIAALALFPALAKELKKLGDESVKTIHDAKKFVK